MSINCIKVPAVTDPRRDPVLPADDAARTLAQRLVAEARHAALAVIEAGAGTPFVSRIAFGSAPDGAPVTLISALAHADAPIIGLSLGQEEQLEPLVRLIVALRVTNPRSYILVAGQFVGRHGDTLTLTGADAAASEVPEALEAMEALWAAVQTDAGALGINH